ncbi:Transcriptional regulator, Middle operon regulator (Mor) family [Oceanospirillum multiglobuliferum]|uniref:Mor transcription activator domain-containing protein n=1 Tax=Oceanospirillum multiglobuliferum TaxID=64969 RepID=A0A1T4QYL0_9GAMM|nr:Mor transcription activator family protein [Oceanospirillum multiglobuliferum]OPX57055.1 hypothetical protein BTE48_01090 [Oceanospirillum multiglobuliferum]SKA08834.1 Transcriptional regulator, Middle operon regulator (Mor) family [Oceanospirillum multiglobuliferum]
MTTLNHPQASSPELDLFGLDMTQPISQHLDDDVMVDRRKWPKDLIEMADFIHAELNASGITSEEKHLLTEKVLIALCFRSGGRGFYLPKADAVKTSLLHKRIHDEWAANVQISTLIRQYDLSEQAIYSIIKEQRRLHQQKIQPCLFKS